MNKELRKGLRTWIEIDKKAIAHNYQVFRNLIDKKCKLLSVVKSNAYGHNFLEFAKEQEKLGTDYFGVDSIVEGIALRKDGIKKPILVLGYTLPEMLEEAIKYDIEIAVSNFETLKEIFRLSSSQKREFRESKMDSRLRGNDSGEIKIHIKVDTGMNRHGFLPSDKEKLLKELKEITPKNDKNHLGARNVSVVGLFTHFASAKNPVFPQYTKKQIAIFQSWIDVFDKAGYKLIKHAGATSGAMLFPEAQFDMVRIGIGLYGIWTSKEAESFMNKKIELKPVLSWKTLIGEIKELPKGSKIGYDSTETLEKNSKIAICPIGYWHGYPRILSGIGRVLVNGKKVKILGRICMDIIMIDISDVKNAKVGDEVILIGKSGKEKITADDVSNLADCSSYELLTRINPLIKRIYI